jgi:hypothetical protein
MSQETLIREHLIKGNSINPLTAFKKFNCLRLSAIIFNLKRDGMDIITNIVTNYKTGKHYAQYHLRTLDLARKILKRG